MTHIIEGTNFNTQGTRITHSVVMVTPEVAARWLESNTLNRHIRKRLVAKYAKDMTNNLWTFAADPIRFSVSGKLLDGQHRLLAIIEANVTLPMLVVKGLPDETQLVMDQGSKRTAGDQLGLHGVKNNTQLAATIKFYITWDADLLFSDSKNIASVSVPEVVAWVEDHPDDVEFFHTISHMVRQSDAPPSIAGAVAIAFSHIDKAAAHEFFELLTKGAGTDGHPILALDKKLQRLRREKIRLNPRDYLAMYIVAWNAWRDGKRIAVAHFYYTPRGQKLTKDNFPKPH